MFVWHDEVVSLESYANVVIKPHIHAYSQWNRDKILFIFPFFSIIIWQIPSHLLTVEFFHSNYIDPFLRMGANYMYKNFKINYKGMEEFNSEEMEWNLSNDYTKEGKDKQNLIPISLGIGVNMWLKILVHIVGSHP